MNSITFYKILFVKKGQAVQYIPPSLTQRRLKTPLVTLERCLG